MGQYNPNSPYIIGEEWVPIRQANYQPDEITERGYTFGIDHTVVPVSGTFNIADLPGPNTETAVMLNLYPEGTEDLTGPVKSVTIPCSAGNVDGAPFTASSVQNPSVGSGISTNGGATFDFNFDVATYTQALGGKRILGMDFLYIIRGSAEVLAGTVFFTARNVFGSYSAQFFIQIGGDGTEAAIRGGKIAAVPISSVTPFWSTASNDFTTSLVYPWRLNELQNFNSTVAAAQRLSLGFVFGGTGADTANVAYAALKVFYCEEKRIKYGGFRAFFPSPPVDIYHYGPNYVSMRGTDYTVTGSIAPGRYTLTQEYKQTTNIPNGKFAPYLSALRQLYELPPQQGRVVNQTLTVDDTFTVAATDVLPQITLHHAGGIVTGCHPYGTQDKIPVYGTITAIQEIEDDPAGVSKQYPQVRFYARRFGNTTAALRLIDVATSTFTASITPGEFDALTEIVDGWKEVNLRFASPPSFATAAGDIDWRWDAVGEIASNQWQVLGCGGPSVTGTQTFAPATYYAPAGATVSLTWQSPTISGTADDSLSDAVLIFSTDPPTVTGFALSTCSQVVTGIAMDCGMPERCIPTGIYGNQIAWDNDAVCDSFTRDLASSWGNATETGQLWANTGGAVSDYNVTLGTGTHTVTGTNVEHSSFITLGRADQDVTAGPFIIPAVPTGAAIDATIVARRNGTSWYGAGITVSTAGVATLQAQRNAAGTITSLGSIALPHPHTAGTQYYARISIIGSILRVKAWTAADTEPGWQVTVTDATITSGGDSGVRSLRNTGNTNGTVIISFDDFQAVPAELAGGRYEIQRWDSADNFWSTILDTGNLCVTGMCDFEARTGVASIYRMRTKNVLDFAGPWVSGTATLPTPGVAGAGDANSVLIFTSNKAPIANLAYVMQFEGSPVETFAFPEADMVTLQRMFGKDFFTAFHPLERGGDQFQRTLLVNAAAIPPPSLANVENLRDLAWADLPYVCVRDELGNRWYANVQVPSVDIRRNRTKYFAQIRVSQVTATPCAIDP